MVIVLMTNNVLYEKFNDHRSFFIFNIFYELTGAFFCQNVWFTLSATNNSVHGST